MAKQKNFAHHDLRGQRFVGSDLKGAIFDDANVIGVDFTGADLRSASFRRTKASGALFLKVRLGTTFWRTMGLNFCISIVIGALSAFAILWNSALIRIALTAGDQQTRGILGVIVSLANMGVILAKGLTPRALLIASVVALTFAAVGALLVVMSGVGAITFTDALAIAVGDVGALAVMGVGAVSIVAAGAITGAFAGVIATVLGITFALAVCGTAAGAVAGVTIGALAAVRTTPHLLAFGWQGVVVAYIGTQCLRRHRAYSLAQPLATLVGAIGGTSFREADLPGSSFQGATLVRANFAGANISRVCWRETRDFHKAVFRNSIALEPRVERLLIFGDPQTLDCDGVDLRDANLDGAKLANVSLKHADITGARLRNADLQHANLAETMCLGTDFAGARLSGACLRDWHIDHHTNLNGTSCDYFFVAEDGHKGFDDRRPHQKDAVLLPGIFETLFTQVRDTIDLMIREGGGRVAWVEAFRRLLREYPEIGSNSIVSVKRIGDGAVITLAAPPGIDKEGDR